MDHVSAVRSAVDALRAGGIVVVVDARDREDEGDLVLAAATATSDQVAFVVKHTTGILCAPMSGARADELQLSLMIEPNTDLHATAFTITVDHITTGTGVSAADRAVTIRSLADRRTRPEHLRRPGHVFPLRAREGGVLERPGHTEATIDLLRLAGHQPVGVISELVNPDGTMMRGTQLRAFAGEHGLPVLTVEDLAHYRRDTLRAVERVASAALPTSFGDFEAIAYRSIPDGTEQLALVTGDLATAGRSTEGALVRIHSECLTGDTLGSLRCDCGAQLERALTAIAAEGCGAVIYLSRPRRTRHRPGRQDSRLCPAAARVRHARRQPGARAPGRRPGLRSRRRHPD